MQSNDYLLIELLRSLDAFSRLVVVNKSFDLVKHLRLTASKMSATLSKTTDSANGLFLAVA